jgi:hypothetical protein
MGMVRTQVYSTEQERDGLARLAREQGRKQSELIREAVDLFLRSREANHRQAALDRAAGMWRDRNDLPDLSKLRSQWDRAEE